MMFIFSAVVFELNPCLLRHISKHDRKSLSLIWGGSLTPTDAEGKKKQIG
jgi:hypothetical protein